MHPIPIFAPKTSQAPQKRKKGKRCSTWPMKFVRWVIAQHKVLGNSPAKIAEALSDYPPLPGYDAWPSVPTLAAWVTPNHINRPGFVKGLRITAADLDNLNEIEVVVYKKPLPAVSLAPAQPSAPAANTAEKVSPTRIAEIVTGRPVPPVIASLIKPAEQPKVQMFYSFKGIEVGDCVVVGKLNKDELKRVYNAVAYHRKTNPTHEFFYEHDTPDGIVVWRIK